MERFQDNRETRWGISKPTFEDPTLIQCPECGSKAAVVPSVDDQDTYKATCFTCGFSKEESGERNGFWWHDDNPSDGYLGYQLWLHSECAGHSLWVFNMRHLTLLESFIGAQLRERQMDEQKGWHNSSLISRLPKWMKSKSNRNQLLRCLQKLREQAQSVK